MPETKDELKAFDDFFKAIMAALIMKGSHTYEEAVTKASEMAMKMVVERRRVMAEFREK